MQHWVIPEQCGCLARQALQVMPPGRRLQCLHICPVRRANDVKQSLQLCLCCAVDGSSLIVSFPAQHTQLIIADCALLSPSRLVSQTSQLVMADRAAGPVCIALLMWLA